GYERKLRLVACALHRQYAALFTPQEQAVVEVAERYAEGLVGAAELAVHRPLRTGLASGTGHTAVTAAYSAVFNRECAARQQRYHWRDWLDVWQGVHQQVQQEISPQACELIRDVVGSPFRVEFAFTTWLIGNDGAAVQLAEGIYQDRAF